MEVEMVFKPRATDTILQEPLSVLSQPGLPCLEDRGPAQTLFFRTEAPLRTSFSHQEHHPGKKPASDDSTSPLAFLASLGQFF